MRRKLRQVQEKTKRGSGNTEPSKQGDRTNSAMVSSRIGNMCKVSIDSYGAGGRSLGAQGRNVFAMRNDSIPPLMKGDGTQGADGRKPGQGSGRHAHGANSMNSRETGTDNE